MRKLTDADAVIHIVGFRFGAEPNQRPSGAPRRSYTQMEFDIARKLEKPVYVFFSSDASVRQPPTPEEKPEDDDVVRLQLEHRAAVQKTNHLYYFFKDIAELRRLVRIPPSPPLCFSPNLRMANTPRQSSYAARPNPAPQRACLKAAAPIAAPPHPHLRPRGRGRRRSWRVVSELGTRCRERRCLCMASK